MNAEKFLNEALGGNMNIGTLKPLAWHGIMEQYARHKLSEAQPQADNSQSDAIALWIDLLTAGKEGVSFETWLRANHQRVAAACAQRHT